MYPQACTKDGWLRRFALKSPVIFSALVLIAAVLCMEIPLRKAFIPLIGNPGGKFLAGLLEQGLTGLLLMWLLARLGLFKKARFRWPDRWRSSWLAWPLVIVIMLNLWPLINGSLTLDTSRPALLVLYLGLVMSVGFFEEVLGRGVILTVMLEKWGSSKRGVYGAVLLSSFLFGAAHVINLIAGRLPILANLTQILYGFFFAVLFAACVLRQNSIWPMVLMHAAFDFGGGSLLKDIVAGGKGSIPVANNTPAEAMATILVLLPICLYGLFILRKAAPSGRGVKKSSSPDPIPS